MQQNHSTNVDQAEIAKFESAATRWWDTESEFKPLHEINPLRTNYVDSIAPLAGKKSARCRLWRWHSQ